MSLKNDNYTLNLVTGPDADGITIAEFKAQRRIDTGDEDTYIDRLIPAVRLACEKRTGRVIGTQTWDLGLPSFPTDRIQIPIPPLLSVVSIKYKLEAGTVTTLADSEASPAVTSSVYDVEVNREPGFVFLQPSQTWPDDSLYPGYPVTIRFTAGLTVDEYIKQTMLFLAAHFHENREPFVVEPGLGNVVQIPATFEWMLFPLRDNF